MEKTRLFHEIALPAAGGEAVKARKRSQFNLTTSTLSRDLLALEKEIKLFHRDQSRGTMTGTSLSKSGAAISTGAERVQKKLGEIESLLLAARNNAHFFHTSKDNTAQAVQHHDKVISTLELQLSNLAKAFQLDLQKSAKKLAGRQERQNNVFGKSVNYIPKGEPIRFRGASAVQQQQQQQDAPLFVQDAPVMLQQQQVKKHAYETSRNTSRLHEVERVESMIGEVSQMFLRVAGMVQEQGELVQDIESMVDDSAVNTNQAQMELLKLFRFVSSDRGLIIKLLIAVLLIGMIMIYFWT